MNALEFQFQLQKSVAFGACLGAALLVGLLLVGAPFLLVLALFGVLWMLTLPYHATLAVYLAIATVNSALIIPGIPGRPFVWELAAGLGWSGAIIMLALRRQAAGSYSRFRDNWIAFLGIAGYCAVLVFLMYYRGVGIRALGSDATSGQMGGRLYVQQIACAIFPLLLILNPLSERTLVKLFLIQCALTSTYLLSDFVFAYGRGPMFDLLLFLELPVDGVNFESQNQNFGIRRFQSLFAFTMGMFSILWVKRPLSDYTGRAGFWMWPLTLGLFAVGMLSGHRHLLYLSSVMFLFNAWSQRFFTIQRLIAIGVVGAITYLMLFAYARDLPQSVQRAISVVPGIEVDRIAYEDGLATMEGRRSLRRAGFEMAGEYRWIGRGYGKMTELDKDRYRFDMTYLSADNGIFYNGTVGLLVNTGLPGTVFMFMVLWGGSVQAWRIMRHVRGHGAEDEFSRFASLQAAWWAANVITFVFLHGDAEYALRWFAMPTGIMIACNWHFSRRKDASVTAEPVVADRRPAFVFREPRQAY
ncbi:MAG: hypothetical protein J0M24_18545 [Verrucomicrobia bacterium]|nr:hypothetical protein [Verrucomicrobiota bacterium]